MPKDSTNGTIVAHEELLLCVDGGCEPKNPGGVATTGWVIYDQSGNVLVESCTVVQDGGPLATNNYAEYCALGLALRWLKDQNWRGQLTVQADSQLLIYQVSEKWKCKAEHLKPLRQRIWDLMSEINLIRTTEEEVGMLFGPDADPLNRPCVLKWVPREQNEYANNLCRIAYQIHQKNKRN